MIRLRETGRRLTLLFSVRRLVQPFQVVGALALVDIFTGLGVDLGNMLTLILRLYRPVEVVNPLQYCNSIINFALVLAAGYREDHSLAFIVFRCYSLEYLDISSYLTKLTNISVA